MLHLVIFTTFIGSERPISRSVRTICHMWMILIVAQRLVDSLRGRSRPAQLTLVERVCVHLLLAYCTTRYTPNAQPILLSTNLM